MLGSVGGWIVFDYLSTDAAKRTAGFTRVALDDTGHHFLIDRLRNTHDKRCYHNIFASRSSSSSSSSRVHRSSLRYFQPPSARMTTILPRCMLAATRNAACNAAPQDGPAKIPS